MVLSIDLGWTHSVNIRTRKLRLPPMANVYDLHNIAVKFIAITNAKYKMDEAKELFMAASNNFFNEISSFE